MKRKVRWTRVLVVVFIVLFLIAGVGLFLLWWNKDTVDLKVKSLVYEYGEEVKIEGKQVLDTKDNDILSSFKADYTNLKSEKGQKYPQVGSYKIPIEYNDGKLRKDTLEIKVKDTVKPEFTKFAENIKVEKGTSADVQSYFKAKDLSPVEVKIDMDEVDFEKSGEYTIEVEAVDLYKNKIVKKAKVTVYEEETPNNTDAPTKNKGNTSDYGNGDASQVTPYTVSEPKYVNGILVVNKKNPVPATYAPGENGVAGEKVRAMIHDMQNAGLDVSNSYSGFRSFDTQAGLYQNYANSYGQAEADTFSARPGYSEHQTGLAFDLLHSNGALVENSAEANWISENAHKYGFIVRYKAGKEHITGYQAEPWHVRYVGSVATDIYQSGLTLEEYLGVSGGGY